MLLYKMQSQFDIISNKPNGSIPYSVIVEACNKRIKEDRSESISITYVNKNIRITYMTIWWSKLIVVKEYDHSTRYFMSLYNEIDQTGEFTIVTKCKMDKIVF